MNLTALLDDSRAYHLLIQDPAHDCIILGSDTR